MGRRGSTTITMSVDVEIETEDFIDNAGVGELVEACIEHDRDTAYEAIDQDDFNEWSRASSYAPSVDAKQLIDDRESPITALVEVANEALAQRGIKFVEEFVHDSRLDGDIRDEMKLALMPTAEEYVGHWDDWQNTIGSIVGEAAHRHGVRAVLNALRENGRLSSSFRESMRLTTPEALLADTTKALGAVAAVKSRPCDCGDDNCGVPPRAWAKHDLDESGLAEAISKLQEDADKFHGEGHFARALLAKGDGRVNHIRAQIVKALTPEIERTVKKGLVRKLLTFVFGSDDAL
jgi:hypothetical protein